MREFMQRMAYKTERFMRGRNGMDDLSRTVYWVGLILLILSLFFKGGVFNLLSLVLFGYAIFRIVSKNIDARQRENTWFLNQKSALTGRMNRNGGANVQHRLDQLKKNAMQQKMRFDERKEYRFFKCKCGTTLRVRRGQGTKELICPVCKEHMTRNTD